MESQPIKVTLKVDVQRAELVASLTFKNTSNGIVYLDKYTGCLVDEPTSDLFEISDEAGKAIKYTGIMVKRRFNKNDFIPIEPDKDVSTTIVLNRWYDFDKGNHKYSIVYRAYNASFEAQGLQEMASNKVIAEYNN